MLPAIILIIAAAGFRVLAATQPDLANFSPLMALAFCGAVYFKDKRMWALPFAALMLSDLWINHYYIATYGYGYGSGQMLLRVGCFAVAIGLGALVARKRSWLNLFSGALGGSLFFYLVTNTGSWVGDAFYAKNAMGWWQAMTVGHPEFAPTLFFFRNTLVSDLIFTGVFVAAMELRASRLGESSLLRRGTA